MNVKATLASGAKNRRRGAVIAALVLALAMLLMGTFAWTSMQQRAVNPQGSTTLPGGRVHDHFDGANKNVFAENFGNQDIFVRILLTEYMEINGEAFAYARNPLTGAAIPGTLANRNDVTTWRAHIPTAAGVGVCAPAEHGDFRDFVTWNMGGNGVFMPTFNQDRESLNTEASGLALNLLPGTNTPTGAPTVTVPRVSDGELNDGSANFWAVGDTATGTLTTRSAAGTVVTTPNTTHTAQATVSQDAAVRTMAQWIAADRPAGNFWVIDTDGWAYWANALAPGTATSFLLDSINMNPPVGEWYYAINVIGEFTNATSLFDGSGGQPGWNDSPNGAPSDDARDLVEIANGAGANPAADVPVGGTFTDNNGVVWEVLHRTPTGETLVVTNYVIGANAPTATPFVSLRFHSANEFVQLRNAEVNNRLVTFWREMGVDMRVNAVPVSIPADFRTAPGNWPTSSDPEWRPPATHLPGMTGMSEPGAGIANADNALFLKSLVEVTRFIGPGSDAPERQARCIDGIERAWWLRSPSRFDTHPIAMVGPNGAIHDGTATAGPEAPVTRGIRPTLWLNP